jgi:phosphoribosylanthranilate isomerase
MPRRTWIKMCGFTRTADVRAAVAAGADALGFVMTPSPRRVSPHDVRKMLHGLPPHVVRFGVFVDERPADVAEAAAIAGVDRVQVHRPEDPVLRDLVGPRILVAFRAQDADVLDAIHDSGEEAFLLDTYSPDAPGGTGRTFDWAIAKRAAKLGRLVLAGGLHAENVGAAIADVRPFGVDVSSGIEESPGVKSAERMRAFVEAVRAADAALAAATA